MPYDPHQIPPYLDVKYFVENCVTNNPTGNPDMYYIELDLSSETYVDLEKRKDPMIINIDK
jgi:hypothetical protein